MFDLKKDSKIYVICPAGSYTGGPESIHQFAHKARDMGIDVRIVYSGLDGKFMEGWQERHCTPGGRGKHPNYHMYNTEYAMYIEDEPQNVLIAPEIYPVILPHFNHLQKAIWWLAWRDEFGYTIQNIEYAGVKHLWQSLYARASLEVKGVRIEDMWCLQDYANDFFTKAYVDIGIKENIVAYNPAKGGEITEKIKEACGKDVKFIPIRDMDQKGVRDLLLRAKVYIDFGHHPGKDRIPREAALCGCCIIVCNEGAAVYDIDIPNEYKISGEEVFIIGKTVGLIMRFFEHYEEDVMTMRLYVHGIREEEKELENQIRHIFNIRIQ